ncbi:hypothetical protein ACFUNF_09050 [Streptomyces sp. NPDC057291]|uniref:hypothetical protein n=1 Tax=Streptomyces sp. NPDC057291 TaxID=3346087 RepID=UPI003640E171
MRHILADRNHRASSSTASSAPSYTRPATAGLSRAAIGELLHVTRQAAFQPFGGAADASDDAAEAVVQLPGPMIIRTAAEVKGQDDKAQDAGEIRAAAFLQPSGRGNDRGVPAHPRLWAESLVRLRGKPYVLLAGHPTCKSVYGAARARAGRHGHQRSDR